MPLLCERCKKPARSVFQQGDEDVKGQLWCKVCHQDRKFSGRFEVATHVLPDTYPGGPITLENYGAQPVTFYSESERQAYMRKHDLQQKERWCPFPGTDRDPAGVQNPEGYVDQQTLDNRAALYLRAHNRGAADADVSKILVGEFSGVLTPKEAIAITTNTDPVSQSRVHRRTSERTDG